MKQEKALPKEGAKALVDAWGNDNEMVLKSGKKKSAKKTDTKKTDTKKTDTKKTTGKKSGK